MRIIYRSKVDEEGVVLGLRDALLNELPSLFEKKIAVVCIGTDRSTGDALGPLVGHALKNSLPAEVDLYGTLENPVHAVNLTATLNSIEPETFILAIDATLGKSGDVGNITLAHGSLQPGTGVGKKSLPAVGNIHISGCVNVGGFMEYSVLQNTRLWEVWDMAGTISLAITSAFDALEAIGNVRRVDHPERNACATHGRRNEHQVRDFSIGI